MRYREQVSGAMRPPASPLFPTVRPSLPPPAHRTMNKDRMLRFATRVLIVFGCTAAFTNWTFAFQ